MAITEYSVTAIFFIIPYFFRKRCYMNSFVNSLTAVLDKIDTFVWGPVMAIFYVIAGLIVILINIKNVPSGLAMIFKMAFNFNAVGGR